ncbi:thioredoxin domain-containing protein [Nocardia sp. NPDC051832]|uniref:DsbA family protein n=1 Tax=Nocardia sp. NPDC051832 TaxID=3155673 RepID=UPI0034136E07
MSPSAKISTLVLAVVAAVVFTWILVNRSEEPVSAASSAALVRPDSHRLSVAADGKVTVVEFLDFECEACGAAFAGVEQVRAEYGDRVTFVMRYFPLPGHRNAEIAARAVEAAGRQGRLEAMYRMMFETQAQWGDQQVSHAETFRGFARQLGLDMPRFEKDWADPAVASRVLADRADGLEMGVQGTPTFFVNGEKFSGRPSYMGLKDALDAELAK